MRKLKRIAAFVLFLVITLGNSTGLASISVSRPKKSSYGYVGQKEIKYNFEVLSGEQPIFVKFSVYYRNECVHFSEYRCNLGKNTASYMPTRAGEHKMALEITDASGASQYFSTTIDVSGDPRYEYPETWEATLKDVDLTGDWREDMIRVAKSQLGYTADKTSFRMDENGKHYYTRYGEWYGAPYSEWCVMFISFCLHYAGVPKTVLSQEGGCTGLMNFIQEAGAFKAAGSGYIPDKGDIIFMDYVGNGTATHAGIVESASADTVYTIEGNTSKGVAEKSYSLNDSQLVGFGSFQTLLERAGLQ